VEGSSKLQATGSGVLYISIMSLLEKNWPLVEEMTDRLKKLKPHKVILFGSYANGNPTEDSDLDVLVVLDSEEIAKNLDEKIKRDMPVSKMLISINRKIAMDLITYSKAEYEYLIEQNDSFVKEINNTGSVLYER
jgi:predicted nucleotidyltransferase